MSKKIENLLSQFLSEIAELKDIVKSQSKQIAELKSQLNYVTTVKIEEDGVKRSETFGNLLLDEMISIKNKLEILTHNELIEKNIEPNDNEFSLSELKQELIKLADMMNV